MTAKRQAPRKLSAALKKPKSQEFNQSKISSDQPKLIFERCFNQKVASGSFQTINLRGSQGQVPINQKIPNVLIAPLEAPILSVEVPISQYASSSNELQIALPGVHLLNNPKVYLKNLFTRDNIARLFAGEFNGKVLRLPNFFRENCYDMSRFKFHLDPDTNEKYLLFEISEENIAHIKNLLSKL